MLVPPANFGGAVDAIENRHATVERYERVHFPIGKFAVRDAPEQLARDILAVGKIHAVPTLLDVLCESTGMGFAAVARISDTTWTACAVKDDMGLGLTPG